jgi:hypothetical protein
MKALIPKFLHDGKKMRKDILSNYKKPIKRANLNEEFTLK